MPEKQIFEIPQQLRELAQKNVEQARAAYGQFMDAMTQAVSAWSSASSDTVTSAFKAVQDGAIRFAKENAEAGFALANELTKAKDLQDVLRLQSSFAQKHMPPPMQSVASPFLALRFCISCNSVVRMRAPEAPMGWPMAIAPPLTLTLLASKPRSLFTAKACAAKASLASTRSRSLSFQPAFSSALREAGIGPEPMLIAFDAIGEHDKADDQHY